MEILKKYLVFICMFQLIGLACVKKANINLPSPEEKLVLVCFINPADTLVMASLKTSAPDYNQDTTRKFNTFDDIENGTVVLSNGAKSLDLKFDIDLKMYVGKLREFKIVAGETYYIVATTPDGKKVSAKTQVPLNKLSIQSYDVKTQMLDSMLDVQTKLIVNDIAGETNYIAVYHQNLLIGQFNNDTSSTKLDTIYNNNYSGYFDNDFNQNKSKYEFDLPLEIYGGYMNHIMIRTYVYNCNNDFYQYNKSVTDAMNTGFGNPFSQPVMVYTNIENGFGCFGAFNATSVSKQIK